MKLRPIVILSIIYIVLSFTYSSLGFLHGQIHGSGSEYTIAFLIPEISGHILFAVVAVAPFLDLELAILASVVAVFIDMDHLLGIFTKLPFIGRPNHSILFILLAVAVLTYFSGRMRLGPTFQIKVAFVIPAAVLSHISYDILAAYVIFGGGAFTFPIFYPFSYVPIAFPLYSFVLFEAAAFALAAFGALLLRRYPRKPRIPSLVN